MLGSPQGVRGNDPYLTISDFDVIVSRENQKPTIRFAPAIKEKLNMSWRNSLIIKLMGVKHTFNYFLMKLRDKWRMLTGQWNVIDIDNGYYIVRFESDADRQHVLCEGPWVITGQYLAIQEWKPCFDTKFDTKSDSITSLTVWIRVTGLHIKWFNIQALARIGALLGVTHKIDLRSATQTIAQYARICVELDLSNGSKHLPRWMTSGTIYNMRASTWFAFNMASLVTTNPCARY